MVSVSPWVGGDATTGELSKTEVIMMKAKNDAVRMIYPMQGEPSTLLSLVRHIFPTNRIPDQIE